MSHLTWPDAVAGSIACLGLCAVAVVYIWRASR